MKLVINASTTSGIIELNFIDKSDTETKEYPFIVDGYLSEEIELDKGNRDDQWTYTVRKYEDTEGSVKIYMY